jgi:hypothetical protein
MNASVKDVTDPQERKAIGSDADYRGTFLHHAIKVGAETIIMVCLLNMALLGINLMAVDSDNKTVLQLLQDLSKKQ